MCVEDGTSLCRSSDVMDLQNGMQSCQGVENGVNIRRGGGGGGGATCP